VRDGAILINLEAFKAIVKHNSLILFTTETARGTVLQQFCPFLQYRLTYVPHHDHHQPPPATTTAGCLLLSDAHTVVAGGQT
jgi:hypothetical protein